MKQMTADFYALQNTPKNNFYLKQVDILLSKKQALQILYLKHCVYNNETT